MGEFLSSMPDALGDLKFDWDTLYYFEAERLLSMRRALLETGFSLESKIHVLDFGYLNGVVPEFLHRFFPRSRFTIFDHPSSPNFGNTHYAQIINSRSYLRLEPCLLQDISKKKGDYDLILLGEIIEHLDPTVTANAFADLRNLIKPNGCLLITTPNAGSIRDTILTLLGHDTQCPPIPDTTMGYPHIHLWSHTQLTRILEHLGWKNDHVYYNHGKGRAMFIESNKHWENWKKQLLAKMFFLSAQVCPRWRDFMVSTWKLKS